MSLLSRVEAIGLVAKHFEAKFTDGRFGADFHEALVDVLAEFGLQLIPDAAKEQGAGMQGAVLDVAEVQPTAAAAPQLQAGAGELGQQQPAQAEPQSQPAAAAEVQPTAATQV